jgi:holo-[acyl-carrier protein] synthase
MKLTNGVDIVEIERMLHAIERHGERFLDRIFTSQELAEVRSNPASLAARFAAKEAVSKALGTGIGRVRWHEIEILRGPARQPKLILHGEAARLADELGYETWAISLSHTHVHALAMVVAVGKS